MHYQPVVDALLTRVPTHSAGVLALAAKNLAVQLRHSMTETTLYNLPLDQTLPDGAAFESAYKYVHPFNIAVAMLTCQDSTNFFGTLPEITPKGLMLYTGMWQELGDVEFEPFPPIRPKDNLSPPITRVDEAIENLIAAEATDPPPVTRPNDLPHTNVSAAKTGTKGKAVRSAFDKTYRAKSISKSRPAWLKEFNVAVDGLLVVSPNELVSVDSASPDAVMAYTYALILFDRMISQAPPGATVDDLAGWVMRARASITSSTAANVANLLAEAWAT